MSTSDRTFDLIRNHIVGNGHRASRYARMNAPGAVDENGEPLGKYTTVHRKLSDAQILDHLTGRSTYAAIIIGADGLVSAACIELDADSLVGAGRVQAAAERLGVTVFSIAVKGAGNHDGSHTWILFADRVKPAHAAHLARQIAAAAGYSDAEIWPKGNAIRLPFGVHTHSQQRGRLLLQTGELYTLDDADQLSMGAAATAGLPLNSAPPEPPQVERKPIRKVATVANLSGPSPIEQFNDAHDIADLLRSYGATETRDGWACNCGVQHSHETQLAVTSQGKLVSYSTSCNWAPHYLSGKCQDAFGLYCLVEHNGNVKAAVAALLPPKKDKTSTSRPPLPEDTRRYTDEQRAAWRDAKNAANAAAAAELRADVEARAAADNTLTPCDRATLREMLAWAAEHNAGSCWLGRASLARRAGYSLGSVKRSVMRLEERGYFESSGKGGRPIDTARRNFSRGSSFDTQNTFVANDDPRMVISCEDSTPDPEACERAPQPPPERACDPQPGPDGLYDAADFPPLPSGLADEPLQYSQPIERAVLIYTLEAMTDDELRAWIAGFGKPAQAESRAIVDEPEAPGASYVGEPLLVDDPRAVPPWLRETGDIAMTRRPDADAIQVEQPAFDLPEEEPLIRCPPSDPYRAQRYYALLGKAKKSTTSPTQRRKLELMAYALEEWAPASEAAARRAAHKPPAVRLPQAVGSSGRPQAAAPQAALGF